MNEERDDTAFDGRYGPIIVAVITVVVMLYILFAKIL